LVYLAALALLSVNEKQWKIALKTPLPPYIENKVGISENFLSDDWQQP
jgi:hypothetical protein